MSTPFAKWLPCSQSPSGLRMVLGHRTVLGDQFLAEGRAIDYVFSGIQAFCDGSAL